MDMCESKATTSARVKGVIPKETIHQNEDKSTLKPSLLTAFNHLVRIVG